MLVVSKEFLKINKYHNSLEAFEEHFLSHPNYPSLYAVTDSFTLLKIENIAVKVPKEQLIELPECFMAIFSNELVLVEKTLEVITITNEKGVKTSLDYTSFVQDWNQVIVAVEPNVKSTTTITKSKKNSLLFWAIPLLILGGSILLNTHSISSITSSILSLFGLFVSGLIVQEQLGVKTNIASKFCSMSVSTSCDSVIKSAEGKLNKWLSFADLPLVFFGTHFLILCLLPITSTSLVSVVNLIAIPIVLYAVYVQKFKLKKWCPLCLVISAIIIIQAVLANFFLDFSVVTVWQNLAIYTMAGLTISAVVIQIKPILKLQNELKVEVNELKRFKRNFKVYQSLSNPVSSIEGFDELLGINFGNPLGPIRLTLILSPSCGHCHKALEDVLQLNESLEGQIYIKILFNVNPENKENPYLPIVSSLLDLAITNQLSAIEALKDWHISRLEKEVWMNKWDKQTVGMLAQNELHKQYEWCMKNAFNYTPVKIVNETVYPNEYQITELKYFATELKELNIVEESIF